MGIPGRIILYQVCGLYFKLRWSETDEWVPIPNRSARDKGDLPGICDNQDEEGK